MEYLGLPRMTGIKIPLTIQYNQQSYIIIGSAPGMEFISSQDPSGGEIHAHSLKHSSQ